MLLSIAAQRMANRNVLVKDLRGVETLGAITCLATDKTGTLTRNQMTVTNVWSGMTLYDASASAPADSTSSLNSISLIIDDMALAPVAISRLKPFTTSVPELEDIVNISYLCSKAKFDRADVPLRDRSIIGDATEVGLFRFAATTIVDSDKVCVFLIAI